ncbi:MAG: hypothetical protein LBO74_10555 [Candidatus Symbiothrix sp.]|jgi:hypothetical protein|nr:hypothetical protein [Candidatus Symbiothrix sp.]
MKINIHVHFLLLLTFMFAICINSKAQVTVGSLLDPQEGALLEFKEKEISPSDSATATKGVLLPKVSLAAYNELSPLFTTTAEPQKTTSKGMFVYNINRNALGLKTGLHVWNGEEWISVTSSGSPGSGTIEPDSPEFSINCGSIDVSQTNLKKGEPSTGYISLRISAPVSAAGNSYYIQTDSVNGVQYEATGKINGGTQFVILESNGGTPLQSGIFYYTITSNSSNRNASSCSADIPVIGKAINILIYGKDNNEGWDIIGNNKDRGVSLILQNSKLFGLNKNPYSYCPVEEINVTRSSNSAVVRSYDSFDIILISYDFRIPGSAMRDSLINFVNRGGVLIHCIESGSFTKDPVAQLHTALFGESFNSIDVKDNMFTLRGNNPYVNGIYRNLTGKRIGRDGGDNVVFNLSDKVKAKVDILAVDALNRPMAIKHKQKPYFVFGDAGIFCGGRFDFVLGSKEYRPLQVTNDGIPQIRSNKETYDDVYNAHFFTNIIMWAINYRQSDRQGITTDD